MAFRDITQEEMMHAAMHAMEEPPVPASLPSFTAPKEWTQLCERCKHALRGCVTGRLSYGNYYDTLLGGCKISKASLELALDEYCMICTPMAAAFEKPDFADTLSTVDWENTSILYGSPLYVAAGDPEDISVDFLRRSARGGVWRNNRIRVQVSMHTLDKGTGRWRSMFHDSYELEPAHNIYHLAARRVPSEYNVSQQSSTLCRQWIETCQQNHSSCRTSFKSQVWRPKRLLKLTPMQGEVSVKMDDDDQHQVLEYATASYCWGAASNVLQLTYENYSRFKDKIPMGDIPLTLQQIIVLAYSLGFDYLWIDSLCIIQDSPTVDWLEQAALMGKTYACGSLNIAATGSKHANDSLIYSRDVRAVQPCSVFVDVPGAPTGTYAIYPMHFIQNKLAKRTINTRGWVFQERLLAPRTLHVGSDQLFWECRELMACETFPLGLPRSLTHELHFADDNPFLKSKLVSYLGTEPPARTLTTPAPQKPQKSKHGFTNFMSRLKRKATSTSVSISSTTVTHNDLESDPKKASIYLRWREAIEAYSECSFTKPMDKLWALQGISDSAQLYLQDELIAGMWKKTLPRDLLWRRKAAGRNLPEEPRAPFWSWAALEGPIAFQHASRWDHFPARVLSISSPKDPRRPVDAMLTLESHVFAAMLTQNQLKTEQHELKDQEIIFDAGDSPDSYTRRVVCIVLHLDIHYENPDGNFDTEMKGIVVIPAEEQHGVSVFIRTAYFECSIAFGQIGKLCHNTTMHLM